MPPMQPIETARPTLSIVDRSAPPAISHMAPAEPDVLDRQEQVGDPAVVPVRSSASITSSGGFERSSPATRSIAGTTPRITIGPIQKKMPQPVSAQAPYPMNARGGHHQADQPQVALLVLPPRGGSCRDGAVRDRPGLLSLLLPFYASIGDGSVW